MVALFAGELDLPNDQANDQANDHTNDHMNGSTPPDADGPAAIGRGSVDDLFAKLRASRADTVVERASADETATINDNDEINDDSGVEVVLATVTSITVQSDRHDDRQDERQDERHDDQPEAPADATEGLSVFQASPSAPTATHDYTDTVFGRRDAELTPLIVSSARKLKRVLADEQNEVLHVLRGAKPVHALTDLLPPEGEHVGHYASAIESELAHAAVAGAGSVAKATVKEHTKTVTRAGALTPAIQSLGLTIVRPLRERLERAVIDADGDNQELASLTRAIYREWKTQRIDEHLDDVARIAFGRGALAALTPGAPVCWLVDPNGPACPDAEDNALAGAVAAGDPFPTDHLCAPAHEGCRCMLQPAPR